MGAQFRVRNKHHFIGLRDVCFWGNSGHWAMSALPPKADIRTQSWNVRFVPKADILQCNNQSHLLGHALLNFRQ